MPLVSSVIYSAPGLDVVTSPWLVGKPLLALARSSSADWLRTLPSNDLATPVSLEILNGGRFYAVADAVRDIHKRECRVVSLRAKRSRHETDGWQVRIWERTGAAITSDVSSILIGDTLATGVTLAGVLSALADELEAASRPAPWPPVHLFAIAGAAAAEAALSPVVGRFDEKGGLVTLTFANAAFSLWKDGTDLRFTGDDARWNERARAEATAKLGPFFSKVKCACFDWGDRFTNEEAHLHEVAAWCGAESTGAPAWMVEAVERERAARSAGKQKTPVE